MEIKKGMSFLCTQDVLMNDGETIEYVDGKIYKSEIDGCITNESGLKSHEWIGEDEDNDYLDSQVDDAREHFEPLSNVEYIWTEATPDIKQLFKDYKGLKEGYRKDLSKVYYFSNVSVRSQDTAFTAHRNLDELEDLNVYYMTPETFVSWMGFDEDSVPSDIAQEGVFNPQPHYDNSKGSLYKVATERGWNAYLFDILKRLERGGKKDPLRQEIEKSIDVLKIWLNELPE